MRYVEARFDSFKREETYRIFVTESLRLAPQKFIKSYRDLCKDVLQPQKIDKRSGDEIVEDVMQKAGLHFKEK